LSIDEARRLVRGTLGGAAELEAAHSHVECCRDCFRTVCALGDAAAADAGFADVPSTRPGRRFSGTTRDMRGQPLDDFAGTERFEIIRELGEGGMGIVYEARDRETDSVVALKSLRFLDAHALYRLKKEFRELTDIRHRNLVSLGELFCEGNRCFFTMELVRGHSFVDYVRGPSDSDAAVLAQDSAARGGVTRLDELCSQPPPAGGFDEPKLRNALAQLAHGVQALHAAGRIHRDIKPSNILVTDEGRVVLLDFGLVERIAELVDPSRKTENGIAGTAAYMAPEQAAEAPLGPPADWYSVGVVLYEALTGMLPFSGPAVRVMLVKQSRDPTPTSQLVGDVPADLDRLTQRLLRCDPAERPGGAEIIHLVGTRTNPTLPVQIENETTARAEREPIVGRERELACLDSAFDETRNGHGLGLIIEGEPGIGKTALVEQFFEQTRQRMPDVVVLRGRCYDQEAVPFNAFDGIVDELSHYLKQLDELLAATLLPASISRLADVFPVLRRVPVVARMPPGWRAIESSRDRRREAFAVLRQLFAALADRVPLIVFIDDLQWADSDSLVLLESLLAEPDPPPLLLLATSRSTGEAGGRPTLPPSVSALVRKLPLGSLSQTDCEQLLARLMRATGDRGVTAAGSLITEAAGNPLFLQELVRYAATRGAVDQHLRLEDVIFSRISDLNPSAIQLMEILAISSIPLTVDVVAHSAEMPLGECVRWVRALRATQLVRVDGYGAERTVQPFHDRIRETIRRRIDAGADSRLTPDGLRRLHLRIGRHLLAKRAHDPLDSRVFEVTHHLNLGAPLLDTHADRREVAELNLAAGRKAARSTAYHSAVSYLRKGAELLAVDGTNDDLAMALQREWMTCEHMIGNLAQARTLYHSLLQHARTDLDRAEVQVLWIQLGTSAGRFAEALATARAALREFGLPVPSGHSGRTALFLEHRKLQWQLGHRRPMDLLDIAENDDPRTRIAIELLAAMAPPAFFVEPPLMSLCMVRIASLSLKHGLSRAAPYGFSGYGTVLVAVFDKLEEGYAFGQLGLLLDERRRDRGGSRAQLLFQNGTFLTPWVRPFAEAIKQLDEACREGERSGDTTNQAYGASARALIRYCDGADLQELARDGQSAHEIASRRREEDMANVGAALVRYASALRGSAERVPTLSSGQSSDAEFLAGLDETRMPIARRCFWLLSAELAYLFGDYPRAAELLAASRSALGGAASSIPTRVDYRLLHALVSCRLYDDASWPRRVALAHTVSARVKWLRKLARGCAANFETAYLIAHGERERIAGERNAALRSFTAAARAARQYGRPKHEALASELAARLCREHDPLSAAEHARAAIAAYERWGATAKAAQLRHLLPSEQAHAAHPPA
jgi:predicted ATPase/serine/threonine protein kinase